MTTLEDTIKKACAGREPGECTMGDVTPALEELYRNNELIFVTGLYSIVNRLIRANPESLYVKEIYDLPKEERTVPTSALECSTLVKSALMKLLNEVNEEIKKSSGNSTVAIVCMNKATDGDGSTPSP